MILKLSLFIFLLIYDTYPCVECQIHNGCTKISHFSECHVFRKIGKEGHLWLFLTYFLLEVNQILLMILKLLLLIFLLIYDTYPCVECKIHNGCTKISHFLEFHVFRKIGKEGHLWMFITYFLLEVNQILLMILKL